MGTTCMNGIYFHTNTCHLRISLCDEIEIPSDISLDCLVHHFPVYTFVKRDCVGLFLYFWVISLWMYIFSFTLFLHLSLNILSIWLITNTIHNTMHFESITIHCKLDPSNSGVTLVQSTSTKHFLKNNLNPVMLVFIEKLSPITLRWVPTCQGFSLF